LLSNLTAAPLKKIFLLTALVFLKFISIAQKLPEVGYFSSEQGLSNNFVTCIFQDHADIMWVGTFNGLNSYDGFSFKIFQPQFKNTNSLISSRITRIAEDSLHFLWIGTSNGISIYDNVTASFQSVFFRSKSKTILFQEKIDDIQVDKKGNIFIASSISGLLRCVKGSRIPEQAGLILKGGMGKIVNYHASAITQDNNGNIWVAVREFGLCLYNSSDNSLTIVNENIKDALSLACDQYNRIWIGTDNSLLTYDKDSKRLTNMLQHTSNILQIIFDHHREMWIATDGDGVYKARTDSNYLAPFPFKNSSLFKSRAVYAIYQDKQERTWIGTLRGAITLIDPIKNRFLSLYNKPNNKNSLINNFTLSCCEDAQNNLWIGTDGQGVSFWNRKKNQFTNYTHQDGKPGSLTNNYITSIINDQNNRIWLATWGGGINRFNATNKQFEHISCFDPETQKESNQFWNLFQDHQNNIWASAFSNGGLYRFSQAANRFLSFDPELKNLLTIYQDKQGQLWAGDYSSLIKIDTISKKHIRYKLGFAVRSVYEDHSGRFWIGTGEEGLLLLDLKTGRFKRYAETDGLASNAVLNIMEDKHQQLWLTTFNGISVFNPETNTFKNISQSDGLLSNQLSYKASIQLKSGELVFGGIKGLNILQPEIAGQPISYRPNLQLTNLIINNQPIELDTSYIVNRSNDKILEIRLPFDKAIVSLRFVSPEYSLQDKINYSYYLDGWDKVWNNAGKISIANYTRLTEGTYMFKVKSTDANAVWDKPVNLLKIIVLPPWYRSWWAYLIYLSTIIFMLYTYMIYHTKQVKLAYAVKLAKMETENEKALNEKEKEINEKRASFFTNISHEFRTPLTLIINPIKELLTHSDRIPDKTELNFIYRNGKRLLNLVDQLLLFRKVESESGELTIKLLDSNKLCADVFSSFVQQAKLRKIQYTFISSSEIIEIYADWEKLEIVLLNLLSNAFKFTPDAGTITMQLEGKGNEVIILVADSGPGISSGIGDKVFEKFYHRENNAGMGHNGFGIGLYLAREIVNAHQGDIRFSSQINNGTEFLVSLPIDALKFMEQVQQEKINNPLSSHHVQIGYPEESRILESIDVIEPYSKEEEIITDKRSILLIDDDEEIRKYLRRILQENFIVYEAANGETGLKSAIQYMPDIIISDIMMEGVSGIELCSIIKEDPATRQIPVILLTSTSSLEIQLNGIKCGADDYITKPFDKEILLARVSNILKNRVTVNQYFFDTITLKKNNDKVSAEFKEFLESCIKIIESNLDRDEFCIKRLAELAGVSNSSLYKKIKIISGLSPNAFIRFIRLRKAAILLLSSNTNINEAAFEVGISDVKYFREQFKKLYGLNPSDYIKKYKKKFNKDFSVIIN
jgi:signal transduction histidine kinase/ligand-binding sensor domain-containing protein/DNA-binding response OmpR family regulator